MKPPRLCFIIETVTDARLVEGLAERFELILVHRSSDRSAISQPTNARFSAVFGPADRLKFAIFVGKFLNKTGQEFDSVLVQGYGLSALVANVAGRLRKIPIAMLVCSPIENYYACRKNHPSPEKPFRSSEWLALQSIAFTNAILGQQYITLSQHLTEVVHRYKIQKPARVIPVYGVDTALFTPANLEKTAIKAKLGLPTTGSLIFFSSRVAPEKDSETLLQATRQLLDAGENLWLLHRSGGYRMFLQDAEKYGVIDRVIATDAVHPHKELPLNYQACDLCVQSSRQEGLGFSPLEALACGIPVVASAVGGLKETIIDGKTGWSYPVGDASALARCIQEILRDPGEAHRRTAAGRAIVCRDYDRQIVFTKLYETLLETGRV